MNEVQRQAVLSTQTNDSKDMDEEHMSKSKARSLRRKRTRQRKKAASGGQNRGKMESQEKENDFSASSHEAGQGEKKVSNITTPSKNVSNQKKKRKPRKKKKKPEIESNGEVKMENPKAKVASSDENILPVKNDTESKVSILNLKAEENLKTEKVASSKKEKNTESESEKPKPEEENTKTDVSSSKNKSSPVKKEVVPLNTQTKSSNVTQVVAAKIKMEKSKLEGKNGKKVPNSENISSPVKKEVALLDTPNTTFIETRVAATKLKIVEPKQEEENEKTEVPCSENIRSPPVKKEVNRLDTETETSFKTREATTKVNNESNAYNDDNKSERGMKDDCNCSGCIIC